MTNKTSRYYIDIIQERSWVWFGKLQTKYIVNEEVTTKGWVGSTYMSPSGELERVKRLHCKGVFDTYKEALKIISILTGDIK